MLMILKWSNDNLNQGTILFFLAFVNILQINVIFTVSVVAATVIITSYQISVPSVLVHINSHRIKKCHAFQNPTTAHRSRVPKFYSYIDLAIHIVITV
jgi:hypothetical protein